MTIFVYLDFYAAVQGNEIEISILISLFKTQFRFKTSCLDVSIDT